MKKSIEVMTQIDLQYDENSTEFKEAHKSYSECIDRGASVDDMLKHTATHVLRCGLGTMAEGVGYVGCNGEIPEDNYSGIMIVNGDYDMFYADII